MTTARSLAVLLLFAFTALGPAARADHFRGGSASWVRITPQTSTTVDPATGWIEITGLGNSGADGVAMLASDPDLPDASDGGTREHIGPVRWMAPESMRDRRYSSIAFGAEGTLPGDAALVARAALEMIDVGGVDAARFLTHLRVAGIEPTPFRVRVRAFDRGNPVYEETGNTVENPLFETANPPNTTTVMATGTTHRLFCDASTGDCPPPLPGAANAGTSPGGVSHVLTWDAPTSTTLFLPDGTAVETAIDTIVVTLEGAGGHFERLRRLTLQWGVDDGAEGAARIVDVARGGLGVGPITAFGNVAVDQLVAPDTRRELLRIDVSAGPGGVQFVEDLGTTDLALHWRTGGSTLGPAGRLEFGIRAPLVDGTTTETALVAIGEGTDTIVDFLVDGRSTPAIWEYEVDGRVLFTSDHPPDPGLSALPVATVLGSKGLGVAHLYELVFAPPVALVPDEGGPSFTVDTLRVIGELGVSVADGAKAVARIAAEGLPGDRVEVTGASATYRADGTGAIDLSGVGGATLRPVGLGSHLVSRIGERASDEGPVHSQSLPPSVRAGLRVGWPPTPIHVQPDRSSVGVSARAVASGGSSVAPVGPGAELIGHEAAHTVQARPGASGNRTVESVTFVRYENGTLVETAERAIGEPYDFLHAGSVDAVGVQLAEVPGGVHRFWFTLDDVDAASRVDEPLARRDAAPAYVEMQYASDPDQTYELATVDVFANGVPWILVGEAVSAAATSAPAGLARADLALRPAVPNPFNPRTTIALEVLRRTHARVTVHDVRGRLVSILVDDVVDPGLRQLVWNGRDRVGAEVGSGVYLVRLEDGAGSTLATTKVGLVR